VGVWGTVHRPRVWATDEEVVWEGKRGGSRRKDGGASGAPKPSPPHDGDAAPPSSAPQARKLTHAALQKCAAGSEESADDAESDTAAKPSTGSWVASVVGSASGLLAWRATGRGTVRRRQGVHQKGGREAVCLQNHSQHLFRQGYFHGGTAKCPFFSSRPLLVFFGWMSHSFAYCHARYAGNNDHATHGRCSLRPMVFCKCHLAGRAV